MQIKIFIIIIVSPFFSNFTHAQTTHTYQSEWTIVGAGIAGITALAVLIDSGIDPSSISWIDPEFNVGRVGKYYRNVPGNVQTNRLILYVDNCPFFKNISSSSLTALYNNYNLDEFQPLHVIADPLIDFTAYLCSKVTPIQDTITELNYVDDHWALKGINSITHAQNVILAIGGHPKRLNYDIPEIPLDDALDRERLTARLSCDDYVAVFGSMHSAILVLKFLSECSVQRIVNFYKNPYFYGVPGLEGATATWAENVLEKNQLHNISRILNNDENIKTILPLCTKVIYAIGYEPNPILVNGSSPLTFDENTGIIDHNLYGIGIAFPPTGIFYGQKIAKNGLHTYLNYAKKLVPQWVVNEKSMSTPLCDALENWVQELPWI